MSKTEMDALTKAVRDYVYDSEDKKKVLVVLDEVPMNMFIR